ITFKLRDGQQHLMQAINRPLQHTTGAAEKFVDTPSTFNRPAAIKFGHHSSNNPRDGHQMQHGMLSDAIHIKELQSVIGIQISRQQQAIKRDGNGKEKHNTQQAEGEKGGAKAGTVGKRGPSQREGMSSNCSR
ncbi:hypothetical protein ACLOJK_007577, partial [Asimina triloba]